MRTVAGNQKPGLRRPSETLLEVLAKNLREHRRQHQLSQEALADRCGLHRTYVGSVERKERNVTLSTLEVLAEALDTTIVQLLTSPDCNDK